MSTTFSTAGDDYYYYEQTEPDFTEDYLTHAMDRRRGEDQSGVSPTQMDKTMQLFRTFRDRNVTVVFGNLARHPMMMNYFLDLAFSASESIGVLTPWDVECDYRVKQPVPDLDFLFVVEPYFASSVKKPSNVRHLIVLTSHLFLWYPQNSCLVTQLHIGPLCNNIVISENSTSNYVYTPSLYHDGKANQVPNKNIIHLDVTNSKSAHEAYLRLLTGQELLRNRSVTVGILPKHKQVLLYHIKITKRFAEKFKICIKEDNFKIFENSSSAIYIEQPK